MEESKELAEGEITSKGSLRGKRVNDTGNGKEFRIRRLGTMPYWEIYFYPGGQVPRELHGYWTSEHLAKTKIEAYLSKDK